MLTSYLYYRLDMDCGIISLIVAYIGEQSMNQG